MMTPTVRCKHGMRPDFCAACNPPAPLVRPAPKMITSTAQHARHALTPAVIEGAHFAIVHAQRQGQTRLDMLSSKTEFVHIHGYPFLWLIKEILGRCPNLRTLQVIPSQHRHLHPGSGLKLLEDRGIEIRQGHVRPEMAWSEHRIVNKNYLLYQRLLRSLSSDSQKLFDELLSFGFESALMTKRYYCLDGEEYLPYHRLAEQFGFNPRLDSPVSAHIGSVLFYLLPQAFSANETSTRLAVNLQRRVLRLRTRVSETAWKSKLLADLGIENLPEGMPLAMIEAFVAVLNASRDGRVNALPDRTQKILAVRYGLEDLPTIGTFKTLAGIGEELSLSRERIRQIEDEALSTLSSDEN